MAKRKTTTTKTETRAEIAIYEPIDTYDGMSAKRFREEVKAIGEVDVLDVRIHSPGGSIFEGLAIYNTLRTHAARKVVHIDGIAASMASIVAMAGDEIEIAENGFVMIHNPLNIAFGESEDLRKTADVMDLLKAQLVAIYARRTGRSEEDVSAWMDAETWMNAQDALQNGFADRSTPELQLAASFDLTRFDNPPACFLKESRPMPETNSNAQVPQAATIAELKAACPSADADFLVAQLSAGATITAAAQAWTAELSTRLAAKDTQIAAANARADAAEKAQAEAAANYLTTGQKANGGEGDAKAKWQAAVSAKMAAGLSRAKAVSAVVREQPELRTEMLAEVNPAR
jgi:ATP-dependent Clp protease, protease subunit